MYITTGRIEDLMNWFHCYGGEAMCLFVGGSLNDKKILQEILDQRDAFNSILGRKVDFFLFWNSQEELFSIVRGCGHAQVFPGMNIGKKMNIYPIEKYRIDEYVKSEIISRSQNVANEICDFFKIDVTSLPCMLIIEKYGDEYYILQLKEYYSAKNLFIFLKKIRIIAEKIAEKRDEISKIQHDKYNNEEKNRLIERKKNIEQSILRMDVVEDDSSYKQKCDDLLLFLEKNGANAEELKQRIVLQTAHIRKKVREYIQCDFPKETVRYFQRNVFGNEEYKRLINEVQRSCRKHKKYINYQNALLEMKKELNDLEYKLENMPDPISDDVFWEKEQKKREELERLRNKFKQIANKCTLTLLNKKGFSTLLEFIDKYKLLKLFQLLSKVVG